jgi:hypothetical protein
MRATRLLIPAALAAALLAPSGAAAGGFATVGVNPPPDGIGTGKTWHVELTISSTATRRWMGSSRA